MKKLQVIKKPTVSRVIEVTKKELREMKEKYPNISIGNHDERFNDNFSDDDIVGVIAGEIEYLGEKDPGDHIPDLWFVNKEYFDEHYEITC